MLLRSLKLKYAIALAVGFLGMEAAGLRIFHNSQVMGWSATYFFLIVEVCLMLALSSWRALEAIHLRRQWILLAINYGLFVIALVLRSGIYFATLTNHKKLSQQIDYTDLLMVLGYIPLFIFLSLPSGKPYPRIFFWIDSLQATLAGYLLYIRIFSIIPFTRTAIRPISGDSLIAFYNLVDLLMCGAATLRFFASTNKDERLFYRSYCWFTWITLVLIAIYNAVSGQSESAGYGQLLGGVSGLCFCIFTVALPLESKDPQPVHPGNLLTAFLNTASPAVFTFSLLALGIDAARTHFTFGMGAIVAAFLLYGLRATILQRRFERSEQSLQEARDRLESLSLKDGLTGVANRRCFDQVLESEWNRAVRVQHPLSLLLMDVDHFKMLNDGYGHRAGDDCLVQIAEALRSALPRSGDLLARYGGEEFAVILPGTDLDGARTVAANMQEAVNALKIRNETAIGLYASISVGISTYVFPELGSASLLVETSDRALYQAKERGRNRIEFMTMPLFTNT